MDSSRKKQTIRIIRIIAAAAVGCPLLLHFGHIYGPRAWNNLHLVNFIVAWVPAVLSILVAFIPDKDLEKRVRIGWRLSVIACGILYSVFLWHQQMLTDASDIASQNQAVNDAVTKANAHADQQFSKVQQQVTTLGSNLETATGNLLSQFSKDTSNLDENIGKVGKPDPPVPAALTFTLWASTASLAKPVMTQYIQPNSDGNFPVDFAFGDGSQTSAKAIDIWVMICDGCSFAKEPAGFEHPTGSDDRIRHRRFGDLNPGASSEKMTIVVKAPRTRAFQIAFRYSCENCGGKMSNDQIATITEGIIGPIFPVKTAQQQ